MIRTPFALAMLLLAGSASADEAEIDGLILNGTITQAGQAFYRTFCEQLNARGPIDFNLAVKERPSARWGVLVWVEYEDRPLFRRFLKPSVSDMQPIAEAAAETVVAQIERQQLQALFQDNLDLAKDEL